MLANRYREVGDLSHVSDSSEHVRTRQANVASVQFITSQMLRESRQRVSDVTGNSQGTHAHTHSAAAPRHAARLAALAYSWWRDNAAYCHGRHWAHSWGHSGPLCHALSLSSWTSMRRWRATVPVATPAEWACGGSRGEWAQHFFKCFLLYIHLYSPLIG